VRRAHFGTYDYTASLGITAAHQHMLHPARAISRGHDAGIAGGHRLWLSDGATNYYAGGSAPGNGLVRIRKYCRTACSFTAAWKLPPRSHTAFAGERIFIRDGTCIRRNWPTRYATVYSFFLEDLDAAVGAAAQFRLEKARRRRRLAGRCGSVAARRHRSGGVLEDVTSLRAINCGRDSRKRWRRS